MSKFMEKARGIKMSKYGPAFKTIDMNYISYNKSEEKWIDVTDESFDFDMFYMIPVDKEKIKSNDFIIHNGIWVRVVVYNPHDNKITVEDIFKKKIINIFTVKKNSETEIKLFYPNIPKMLKKIDIEDMFDNMDFNTLMMLKMIELNEKDGSFCRF